MSITFPPKAAERSPDANEDLVELFAISLFGDEGDDMGIVSTWLLALKCTEVSHEEEIHGPRAVLYELVWRALDLISFNKY